MEQLAYFTARWAGERVSAASRHLHRADCSKSACFCRVTAAHRNEPDLWQCYSRCKHPGGLFRGCVHMSVDHAYISLRGVPYMHAAGRRCLCTKLTLGRPCTHSGPPGCTDDPVKLCDGDNSRLLHTMTTTMGSDTLFQLQFLTAHPSPPTLLLL